MRAKEFIVEYRDRMYQYIKSIVPTWPDYVVKDWLYANFVRGHTTSSDADLEKRQETARSKMFRYQYADQMNKLARSGKTGRQLPPGYQQPYRSNQDLKATLLAKRNAKDSEPEYAWTFATIKKDIPRQLADIGLTVDTKWQLVPNMKFTMNMFDPKTKQLLIGRAGGSSDLGMGIPKDKERHATQAALAQQQGGVRKEPVILIKTAKGYELLEGWHRTIQHFAKYPNGYTGPAYVAIAQDKQGLAEGLEVDVPNEDWLQDKIDYAKSKGRNSFGVPYMGSTTAIVRGTPPRVKLERLASLPGMRNEQMKVRKDDLKWLMDYMERTGKLPPMGSSPDREYLPFIMVAYNGEAWVNEGNHRIMAAYRLNWPDMPVEIRYFDGGERVASGPMAPGKIGLGPVKEQKGMVENFANSVKQTLNEVNSSAVHFRTASTDNYQNSFTVTAIADGKNVGHFSFFRDPESDDVHNQAEVTDDVRGKGYGKALLLKAIEVANDHGLGFQEDSQSLSHAQSRVYDSLYDAGWIVDADGYWFLTHKGEQELARLSTIQKGAAEGSTMSWIVYRQDTTLYPNGERDHETEVVKTFNNDREAEDYANKLNAANRDVDVYYFVRGKQQGVAEGKLNFEEGDCPIFAIALHRLSKMPLMALVEYDEQMGSTVLIHAYVKLDDRWRLDASGETDVNWMLQKYPNNGNAEEIEISEKDLLELGYGKSKCPTLQQVLPHAKEVLQNIEEGQQGVAEGKSNTIPKIGINVRSDGDIDYASLIVDGKKKYESRKTDSLRPYVGKTVGIVRTGNGPAVAIGQATIGEPIVVNAEKFDLLRKKHLVPKDSKFDIDSDDTKYLYPMINPVRWENEKSIKHKGIVSRKIQESMAYINQSNKGGNLEGYVVDSNKPQLINYLSSQGADNNLINQLKQKYKTIAIIRNMYVDEDQRGQGYGNQLVSDAIDDAAGNHANAIICVADIGEDNAIDLVKWYENFGFEVVGKAGSDPVMVLEL